MSSMGEDGDTQDNPQGMPLPPLPPGISFPLPPPPPPPSLEVEIEENITEDEVISEEPTFDNNDSPQSNDFNSHWERRKASDPNLSVGNRESMYGHIDRIATGEVGTLLDRFSNRFGSELDREIIVLRKKQQQEMRAIKPTVELIQAPSEEYLESEEEISTGDSDDFVAFFEVVNNLLGNMDDAFVNDFIASESFSLFEKVGADPSVVTDEEKSLFFNMINDVLGNLPDDKVNEFIASPEFSIFEKMGELYGE
ncbi:TPA: hypothetical protein HA324_07080 [Candidatus Thalassarchaeaceae archaeon]|nr:hypothetical protein [Euryarchaeota archaeon]HIH05823.1 hypothetical protein [Candidatus Thalassarchaeaceae archaeon]MBT3846886.1 hypothetical protein [Euryarchaeota archaeon]MBT4475309.1 hypothetical protein [Euryarchaeota archaeon]MBT4794390.1 hypothetical protein [Euryarchaeota archaeon]